MPTVRATTSDNALDTVERIEKLCVEDIQPNRSDDAAYGLSTATPEIVRPIDVLSKDYLQNVVNYLATVSESKLALVVVSKTGSLIDSAQIGWSSSEFRTQIPTIKKVTRECIWSKCSLRSTPSLIRELIVEGQKRSENADAIAASQSTHDETPMDSDSAAEPIGCSLMLSKLGLSLGTPDLHCSSFPLAETGGSVVLIQTVGNAHPSELDQNSGSIALAQFAEPIDTWFMIRRCQWFNRWISAAEWLRTRPRWLAGPIVLLIGIMFIPIPYFPKRNCAFEPSFKQLISSPIQGQIGSCDVRPGAQVKSGELLARIDEDQLVRDLANAQADLNTAAKKREAALALKSASNYSQASLESQQALLRVESLQEQLNRLEVRSPIDGVVVLGDWQRSIGSPVTMGQNLFEVAKLDSMTAELQLTALDLGSIDVGDGVSIRADSSGGKTFYGKISRIEPRATIIDGKAIFKADVAIEDVELQLRPGMKGTAHVSAGWKPIGWLLFSRPYRWLADQWIW